MKHTYIKKILTASIISLFLLQATYALIVEPTIASAIDAVSSPTTVVTLTVDAGITITAGTNVTMDPNLGISANSSIGSSAWTVKTNNAAGYTLSVKASTAPALKSTGAKVIADYTEATPGTPDAWVVGSGAKEFGFSAYGTNVPGDFGTGASCGTSGTPTPTLKYLGFKTTDKQIATLGTVTSTAGVATNICFAAAQNGVFADSGIYTATITATASTL